MQENGVREASGGAWHGVGGVGSPREKSGKSGGKMETQHLDLAVQGSLRGAGVQGWGQGPEWEVGPHSL